MIAAMDLVTSELMSFVWDSACSARVRTALSTASFASSVFGLNSFFRSESKSVASAAPIADVVSCWDFGSAISVLRSMASASLRRGLFMRVLLRRKRLKKRRILQQLAHELFCPALAIHVG